MDAAANLPHMRSAVRFGGVNAAAIPQRHKSGAVFVLL
jgi:hypothetical protein